MNFTGGCLKFKKMVTQGKRLLVFGSQFAVMIKYFFAVNYSL